MDSQVSQSLGEKVILNASFEDALERVVAALKVEGFGVLTEIDVKATMKAKLDVDYLPYKILGACNPPLANRALSAAPEVGLLLPCNVTVRQLEDGVMEVALVNPLVMMSVAVNPAVKTVAEEAAAKLRRVAQALAG